MSIGKGTFFVSGLLFGLGIFFLTGASGEDNKPPATGRYQISTYSAASGTNSVRGWVGYVIIDTQTGKVTDKNWETVEYPQKLM